MANLSNEELVKQMFKNFAEKNMPAVIAAYDNEVVWVRAGEPDIPFSGTFNGIQGMADMFKRIGDAIQLKHFTPQKFCSSDDTVIVLGHDEALVKSTGKTYQTDWVQAFTFKNNKIIRVQVYMDTLAIAKAFTP